MTAAAKTSRATSVKVPGESTDTPMTAAGETDADALVADAAGFDDGQPEPVITMTPAQLDAAIARGIARHQAEQRARIAPVDPLAGLPDQSEIDPKTIERMVLSKQGYVVPHKYGEPKAQLPRE